MPVQRPENQLTREEAARYLGVSVAALAAWACTGRYALPYIKVGRLVRYRQQDLDAWLASRIQNAPPPEAA